MSTGVKPPVRPGTWVVVIVAQLEWNCLLLSQR